MTASVSVIMGVRNGDRWITEAVNSILSQTLDAFELLVIDDGSTDGTRGLLGAYTDARLKVVHQEHRGLTRSLNHAIRLSTAPLRARMDADDVAAPPRLAHQADFLRASPHTGLLGTACHEVGSTGRVVRTIRPPVDDAAI